MYVLENSNILLCFFYLQVAFLCSAISPLLATKSFGIFASLAVMINYITVVVFFPTVVVMYHVYFENFQWPCFKICTKNKIVKEKYATTSEAPTETEPSLDGQYTKKSCDTTDSLPNKPHDWSKQIGTHDSSQYSSYIPNYKLASERKQHVYTIYDGVHPKRVLVMNCDSTDTQKDMDCDSYFIKFPHKNNSENWRKEFNSDNQAPYDNRPVHQQNGICDQISENNQIEGIGGVKIDRKNPSFIVRFFKEHYFSFVTHRYLRWALLPIFVGLIVTLAIQASKLGPETQNASAFNYSLSGIIQKC